MFLISRPTANGASRMAGRSVIVGFMGVPFVVRMFFIWVPYFASRRFPTGQRGD